ncbi:hypothetical protein [Sphingomonas xinjiangensis]|uniref:Uncharacterized protein n=1 Tax=Sphingomonas xinjiangensis TaxID=643568 RepID=A0A840YU16_9SPHN|nr:hypothetical protein [Sphingomonas xinjiangensis]MBB5713155.1 hypothetical protein [Sphingomonas xinjiangensis]
MNTPDLTGVALDAPLDVLITFVPSLSTESIDPDHLSDNPDQPITGEGTLIAKLDAAASAPAMPGSLQGLLPDDLFVFADGADSQQPVRFGRLGWGSKCHVVTERFKSVLEALPSSRSEFYPVSVVYRDPASLAELGGGEVVRGSHWIWYGYAVHDIIDVSASCATFHPTSQPRLDIPGNPVVAFHVVGGDPADGPRSLVLGQLPYAQDAAFHVLGWWSRAPFVAPSLMQALQRAGDGMRAWCPQFAPIVLDQRRAYVARMAVEAGKLSATPKLRIVGTEWFLPEEYRLTFFPARPFLAGG